MQIPLATPATALAPHEVAVLVIHGFTATQASIHDLAQAIAKQGYVVHTPLLPGHGTVPADLAATTWSMWAAAIHVAVDAAQAQPGIRAVALVGQSLGGLLALHTAANRHDIAAVVSLAAPVWLDGLARAAARVTGPAVIHRHLTWLPKLGGADIADRTRAADVQGYPRIPTAALAQLIEFMAVVKAELPHLRAPVCVMHSLRDHTAPVACASFIASATRAKRLRLLRDSFHLLAVDVERDIVAKESLDFLNAWVCRAGAPARTNDAKQ